ncbi:MAG: hypothetical protein ACRDFB_03120, partial [Rhabdochlamydiaceae bacterium]
IKQLNQESHILTVASWRNKKLQTVFGSHPEKYTNEGIQRAVQEAAKGNIKDIVHQLTYLTAPLDMLGYIVGKFPGYIVTSHITPPIRESLQNNPELLGRLTEKIGAKGGNMIQMGTKGKQVSNSLTNILRNIGLRVPLQ